MQHVVVEVIDSRLMVGARVSNVSLPSPGSWARLPLFTCSIGTYCQKMTAKVVNGNSSSTDCLGTFDESSSAATQQRSLVFAQTHCTTSSVMSRLASSPLRLVWLGLLLSRWCFVDVQGQGFCRNAESLSRGNLGQATQNCPVNLTSCASRATCVAGCTVNTPEQAVTTCTDGCSYTSGGYTVSRRYTSGYSTFVNTIGAFPVTIPVISLGFSHTFTAGPLQGNFIYSYGGDIADDLRVIPKLGGSCSFLYNNVACSCGQFYCDASRTTYGNRINCTNVAGGTVIDFCKGFALNKTLSPLEILYAVPGAVCSGYEIGGGGSTPVKAPTKAPIVQAAPTVVAPMATVVAPMVIASAPTSTAPVAGMAPTSTPPLSPTAPTAPNSSKKCGLFQLSLFCLNGCGLFGRILGLCQ